MIDVPGAGVFQPGTQAAVPRDLAYELLQGDDWIVAERGSPVVQVVLRVGQWDKEGDEIPFTPDNPADFGDLPDPEDFDE